MQRRLFKEIRYLNLYSDNQENMISFFRDRLGLEPLPDQDQSSNWYGFNTKGAILAIEPKTNRKNYKFKFNDKNPFLVQFIVESKVDLEEANDMLIQNGIELKTRSKQMSYGTITNFLDPDGNLFEILLPK